MTAAEVLTTWCLVMEILKAWQVEKKVQSAAAWAIVTALGSESAKPPEQDNVIDLGDNQEDGHGPTLLSSTLLPLGSHVAPPLTTCAWELKFLIHRSDGSRYARKH